MRFDPWIRFVFGVGFVKLAGTFAGVVVAGYSWLRPGAGLYETPPGLDFLSILVFGTAAGALVVLGREDRRAISLAGFFLCVGTAFCMRWLNRIAAEEPYALGAVLLDSLKVDALIAFFFWRFVRDFPQVAEPAWLKKLLRLGTAAGLVTGVLYAAINFVLRFLLLDPGPQGVHPALQLFAPKTGGGIYHGILMTLTALAVPLLVVKLGAARGEERRRVRLFIAGVVAGLSPILVEILLELSSPAYRNYMMSHSEVSRPLGTVLLSLALTVPLTTAYAVLVHQILDLKLLARKALQYGLARYSILLLVSIPLLFLTGYIVAHWDRPISQIFSGGDVPFLLGLVALGVVALRHRHRLLDAIDRRFFREHYDARQILTLLVERIRSINETSTLANLVSREIDLALHLEDISMMVLDPRSGMLNDPRSRARRLDASTQLALTVSNASDPLEIDLENRRSPLHKLPEAERHWLVDSGFRLIVPILARDGSLLGMVGLGEKKSGLPFMREDLQLLHAIASSAAWVLELDLGRQLGGQTSWRPADAGDAPVDRTRLQLASELAKECARCGTVYMGYVVFCSLCSRKLEPTRVPYVLPGKFRFEKRVGVGGMGIVYRGADLALGRHVALKTLRRVSPEDALRLRREARAAAAVTHPHLAAVYGLETWQGTPFLVMELLEGGTLADRIEQGALPVRETVELGIAMAEALAHLHAADILHRDIKPTNIGFTRDGVVKLMDFGIARMVYDLDRDGKELPDTEGSLPTGSTWQPASASRLVGTLGYLSPEALDGEPADPTFDLWSLGVVLYECLLGARLFAGGEPQQVMTRIRAVRLPDLPPPVAPPAAGLDALFRQVLHKTRSRRPATALELRRRLQAFQGEWGAERGA